ncbi:hypothetical protein [Fibrella aquatilis]|uniref:Uncharacterized protein n=1 Tax=Fibrella aquatilis TaxID=2817059 RepID=A0A939GDJ3_9BACT|nr:hypothetical protein [Fibrella aquatilis]MBO0934592.1 hypothetical protein [Fibrella aquatilis]
MNINKNYDFLQFCDLIQNTQTEDGVFELIRCFDADQCLSDAEKGCLQRAANQRIELLRKRDFFNRTRKALIVLRCAMIKEEEPMNKNMKDWDEGFTTGIQSAVEQITDAVRESNVAQPVY